MSGLEVAGLLVSAINPCIDGFKLLSTFVKNMRFLGRDAANLEFRVEKEQSRLIVWARIHNLVIKEGEDPVPISDTIQLAYITNTVLQQLARMDRTLGSIRKLASKYSITTSMASPVRRPSSLPITLTFDAVERLAKSPEVAQQIKRTDSRRLELSKKSGFRKRLRWTLNDKKRLKKAVSELEACNNQLFDLMLPSLQVLLFEALSSNINPPSSASSTMAASMDSLTIAGRVGTTHVRFKQELEAKAKAWQLAVQGSKKTCEPPLEFRQLPQLFSENMSPYVARKRSQTALSKPDTQIKVLVEWKRYDPRKTPRDEVMSRIDGIWKLLEEPPKFLSNVIPCLGYFEDNRPSTADFDWIGLVYRMPLISAADEAVKPTTLRELLEKPKDQKRSKDSAFPKPSLGARFNLAKRLSETLLSIHNCGWLHKGLRPENIVFFCGSRIIVDQPYFMGWEYSRPDAKGEVTETVSSSYADADLYQHPDLFSSSVGKARLGYCKEYDHYQLGCILLEIGLWKSLPEIRQALSGKLHGEDWRDTWRSELIRYAEKMKRDMGEIYCDAVVKLLRGLEFEEHRGEFWDDVVLALSKCNA
jgi:hypothetical protein